MPTRDRRTSVSLSYVLLPFVSMYTANVPSSTWESILIVWPVPGVSVSLNVYLLVELKPVVVGSGAENW